MIKQLSLLLALIGAPAVSAVELTPANWDEQTSGKTVFLKFYAPWVSIIIIFYAGEKGAIGHLHLHYSCPEALLISSLSNFHLRIFY